MAPSPPRLRILSGWSTRLYFFFFDKFPRALASLPTTFSILAPLSFSHLSVDVSIVIMAMELMRVCVVGGNAVSAFLSWRLQATNACDVTLVWKSGFDAVHQYGISFKYVRTLAVLTLADLLNFLDQHRLEMSGSSLAMVSCSRVHL